MEENNILLTKDTLELFGFDLIRDELTFCFYSGGIVIVPGWKTNKLPCHYESRLGNNNKIQDTILAEKMRQRGIEKKDSFIKIKDHYIEINPHGRV